MAVATGTAALIAGGIAGASSLFGSHKAAQTQDKASDKAIALATAQEAERKREWEAQQKAAAYQWQVMQANLAPYRAARAAVLQKYGINTNVDAPPMPEGFGMPGGMPAPTMDPRRQMGGGTGGYGSLGLGLGVGAGALQAYLSSRNPNTFGPGVGGSGGIGLGEGGPGYAMSPMTPYGGPEMAGPPTSQIQGGPVDLSNLYNWADWQQAIGGSAGG
jgi:hypothetical protein